MMEEKEKPIIPGFAMMGNISKVLIPSAKSLESLQLIIVSK